MITKLGKENMLQAELNTLCRVQLYEISLPYCVGWLQSDWH